MSILEQARENLRDHGVKVELPETTEFHQNMNTESEALSSIGLEEGLEAATYDFLNNRMDVYAPLAIDRAIQDLDEEENEQTVEAIRRNQNNFSREINSIESSREDFSYADRVKLSKIQYEAALQDDEVDEGLKEKLTESVETGILHDSEHELVHASHYQSILDEEVDSLQEEFQKYKEDVENLNDKLGELEKREINEGIKGSKDLELSAAMKFVDDDSLRNIISLAGREEKRWNKKFEKISQKYYKRIERVKEEFKDNIQDEAAKGFDDMSRDWLKSLGVGINFSGGYQFEDAEELVDNLEEDSDDEYETMIENGCEKTSLMGVLSTIKELEDRSSEETKRYHRNLSDTEEHLEKAIIREAEIQGDFEGFLQQYVDRMDQGGEMPRDFTEAHAQFWTGYREGILEDDRDEIFKRLEGYEIDGLDDTMNDLLQMYDEAEGTKEERVSQVMSSQLEYLDENYDLDPSK